jgi:hypothetical protein
MVFKYPSGFLVILNDGHCTTSRKVEGSIPDGGIGIFH